MVAISKHDSFGVRERVVFSPYWIVNLGGFVELVRGFGDALKLAFALEV